MALTFTALSILAVLVLLPMYYLLVNTFKTTQQAAESPLGLPTTIDFSRYVNAFVEMDYPRAFLNTAVITVGSVAGTILVASMAGYALSRKARSRFAGFVFLVFLAGLMFPYQMAILGLYDVVLRLGIMNTHLAVILINASTGLPFAIFLFYAFTRTIPIELEEAAHIDGAGILRTFFTIVFPLLRPIVATVAILTTLNVWNDFMGPLYFLRGSDNAVITQQISRNVGQFTTDWTSLFPMLVLGVLPLLIFYLVMQRHIIGGVSGSLKG
ncbi:sugar ABC transporter permease [Agromyces mangrovi Wang et al. 2018]|nr:sugar ABC transporter permease [Agromyces mangrovi]